MNTHKLTLYNDDEHDFAYITSCLMEFCDYGPVQAHQCAVIVDGVGKYDLKHGSFDEILELKTKLEERNLIVELNESKVH